MARSNPTVCGEVLTSGLAVRLAARQNQCSHTARHAPSYIQANLIVLPHRYAADFRSLCARNPVPCPLIAESACPGNYKTLKPRIPLREGVNLALDIDLRQDAPLYNVYDDSKLVKKATPDVVDQWTEDHVAFLIGCSFSFDAALGRAGLTPMHAKWGRNVPMYRTCVSLAPAGVFCNGMVVVSMRSYRLDDVSRVRDVTRKFPFTHGEPLAWGWDAVQRLGIADIDAPDFGDAPLSRDGTALGQSRRHNTEVPVFWGCGVTPQEAVRCAGLEGVVMGHFPGHMIVLDCKDEDIGGGGSILNL